MKRVWVGIVVVLAGALILILFGTPVAKMWVKRRIALELRQFVREGSVQIQDISLSPKRRLARLGGIRVLDRSGHLVLSVENVEVHVRRIHHRHADASIYIHEPTLHLDAACADDWSRLIRREAFMGESPLRVDRVDVTAGRLELVSPGLLAESETLAFSASSQQENEQTWIIHADAHGARTDVRSRLEFRSVNGDLDILPGTSVDLATSNLSWMPSRPAANGAFDQVSLHLSPAETVPSPLRSMQWRVSFGSPDMDASFDRILPVSDTQAAFDIDRFRIRWKDESVECFESRIELFAGGMRMASSRWIRRRTGLSIYDVRLDADTSRSSIDARLEGFPIRAKFDYGHSVRATAEAGRIPMDVVLREAGESMPLTGFARITAQAQIGETGVAWQVSLQSPDLRLGPAFGKLSIRADVAARGSDTRIDELSGMVEPAPGVPILVNGKGTTKRLTGRMSLRDCSLKDIRLLAETFGKEVPLVGESGRASLDVDFRVGADEDMSFKGRMRIAGASLSARQSTFRVDGLECDLPFERSSDTGKLVLDEVPSGSIRAKELRVGPYVLTDLAVTTKSRGDKWYADVAPFGALGGMIRAKSLFYFSDAPHEIEISVDSLSLREVLDPIPESRRTLSGLVSGVAKLSARGTDWMRPSGTFWAKATEGRGERMIAARKFLENIGGKAVKKMRFPPYVPYRRGSVRMRFVDGRIFFDEVTLEARSMLRGVRIGRVRGSYRIKDLIDVLSNVSTEDVKVEIPGRKKTQ